jgi:serine/threonine protein kinase
MACGGCGGVITIPEDRIAPGIIVAGDFQVQSLIARGGMGSVYVAHQLSLAVDVALKVLHPELSDNTEFIADFIAEARNAAQLNHPNVMGVTAVGQDQDIFYIAMELIPGSSVSELLEEGPVEVAEAVRIIRKVAIALNHAWSEKQIVHRDIKPDNIMVRERDRAVKLADLGLARPASELDEKGDEVDATPQYMCPEVMTDDPIDNRSDIYSLGATWYHMLTGRYAFIGDDAMEIVQGHLSGVLEPPGSVNPDVPPSVSAIIVKMMEKRPADRYQSYDELLAAIKFYERETRRSKKRPQASAVDRNIGQEFGQSTPKTAMRIIVIGVICIVVGSIAAFKMTEPVDYTNLPAPAPPAPRAPSTPKEPVEEPPDTAPDVVDFSGVWTTKSYGEVIWVQDGTKIEGYYDGGGGHIIGQVEGNVVTGRWKESDYEGDFVFTMNPDEKSYEGKYKEDGRKRWVEDWDGKRKDAIKD